MKLFYIFLCLLYIVSDSYGQPVKYFKIKVVDEKTGRGVPLVELKTVNQQSYYTDNNGIVAFYEPGLMNQEVYFHLKSHGYEYPRDGFGYHGKGLMAIPGDSAVIKIERLNIAERLYRVTGGGLYVNSLLTGSSVPIKQPVLNGKVLGQDTFIETLYKGKIYWFWGDSDRPSYPLGNFATSGATSELPGKGGLDPSIGVDLSYFLDEKGFSKKMCPLPGPGPVWIHWLTTLKDSLGIQRLIASYTRIKTLAEAYEHGLALFDDSDEIFKPFVRFDLQSRLFPEGHSFRAIVNNQEYLYFSFAAPYSLRVIADWKHVTELSTYEAFTCLPTGSRYDTTAVKPDRGPDGRLIYGWKVNTDPLSYDNEQFLLKKGILKSGETWQNLYDILTGKPVIPHAGSLFWNDYRKKWIAIFHQRGGTSALGEVWFAEADTPTGPWAYARKVVTHDNYTFYNVGQHPLFDQDKGRLIYFEGTYTDTFSGNPLPTPRYNYNQIMYRLDLEDSRLYLPSPVYRLTDKKNFRYQMNQDGFHSLNFRELLLEIPFFAVPPDRCFDGLVTVYEVKEGGKNRLQTKEPGNSHQKVKPLFYGFPGKEFSDSISKGVFSGKRSSLDLPEPSSPMIVPLFEFRDKKGNYFYSVKDEQEGLSRTEKPICRVWKNPSGMLNYDFEATPVPFMRP